jgi:hypothetical protein
MNSQQWQSLHDHIAYKAACGRSEIEVESFTSRQAADARAAELRAELPKVRLVTYPTETSVRTQIKEVRYYVAESYGGYLLWGSI